MKYRVWKRLKGFVDIEAEDENEAYNKASEISLNQYEFTEEETDIEIKQVVSHGQM